MIFLNFWSKICWERTGKCENKRGTELIAVHSLSADRAINPSHFWNSIILSAARRIIPTFVAGANRRSLEGRSDLPTATQPSAARRLPAHAATVQTAREKINNQNTKQNPEASTGGPSAGDDHAEAEESPRGRRLRAGESAQTRSGARRADQLPVPLTPAGSLPGLPRRCRGRPDPQIARI